MHGPNPEVNTPLTSPASQPPLTDQPPLKHSRTSEDDGDELREDAQHAEDVATQMQIDTSSTVGPNKSHLTVQTPLMQFFIHVYSLPSADTALSRSARLKDDQQLWCHFSFTFSNIIHILEASPTCPANRKFVQDRVRDLFPESNIWPAGRSLFYLGILPPLFPPTFNDLPLHTRVAHECHTGALFVASCQYTYHTHSTLDLVPHSPPKPFT